MGNFVHSSSFVPCLAIPVLFVIGICFGSAPILMHLTEKNKAYFSLANAFSGGIFIGAALLHMLPDAAEDFENLGKSMWMDGYPWGNLIAALGFVCTLFLEVGIYISIYIYIDPNLH